jgi:hypothetical protein
MNTHIRMLSGLAVAVAMLLVAASVPSRAEELDEADIFFELNDTDGDLGIHCRLDGEPWKRMMIVDPLGRRMLQAHVTGRLAKQGLTEHFFESGEPTFDELAPEDFFARFPEGEYEMEGTTLEGEELEGEDVLSHVMPAPAEPTVSGVSLPDGCDGPPAPVSEPVIIAWPLVEDSHPDIGESGSIQVQFYQVIVEKRGDSPLAFTVDLPPGVTQVVLPVELTSPGDELKVEVLVKLVDGNSTAVEGCVVVQ